VTLLEQQMNIMQYKAPVIVILILVELELALVELLGFTKEQEMVLEFMDKL